MPFNLAKISGANFIHQLTAWPTHKKKPQAHKTFVVFEILLSFKSMTYFGNSLETSRFCIYRLNSIKTLLEDIKSVFLQCIHAEIVV